MTSPKRRTVTDLLKMLEKIPGSPGNLDDTLQHITLSARDFFEADDCIACTTDIKMRRAISSIKIVDQLLIERPPNLLLRKEDVQKQSFKRNILVLEDLEEIPREHLPVWGKEKIHSLVAVPLYIKYHQEFLGVLYLAFQQRKQFSSSDHELLLVLAEQASLYMHETWLLYRMQEVARVGQELNHELDTVDVLFERLLQRTPDILDISHAFFLSVYQRQTSSVYFYMQEEGHRIHLEHPVRGASKYAMETGQTIFIEQLSKQAEHLPFRIVPVPGTTPKESYIFVPLMLRDEPLGILSIQHPEPYAYKQEDRFILELLANYIALAMHNIRLYRNLHQLNETGEILTQHPDSERTLQMVVDKVRDATNADLVVLYPYEPEHDRFRLPPQVAGELLHSTSWESMSSYRPDSTVLKIQQGKKPIFAKHAPAIPINGENSTHFQQGSFEQNEQICSTAALPLWIGEEAFGVLFVNFRQPQRFDATQKLFIEGLAYYVAVMVKNSLVFGMLSQRRLHELVILQRIDRELISTVDLEAVLNTLLKLANEQVQADWARILLYNSRNHTLEPAAVIGRINEPYNERSIPLYETKGITRWAIEQKKPARVGDVHHDPQWEKLYIQVAADTISELDVPLFDGEEIVGALNFESRRANAFSQEDEHFLVTLAGHAVLAIKKAQAYAREKRFAEESQILNEVSKEIIGQLDYVRVFNLILDKALELTSSTLGSLHLYNEELQVLLMVAGRGVAEGKKPRNMKLGEGIVGYVAERKQLLNVPDVTCHPWNSIYINFASGVRSELTVPMLAGKKLRGVLNIESSLVNKFTENDERLMQELANLAVVALQYVERYQQAEREALRFALLYQAGQELSRITSIEQLDQAYEVIVNLAKSQSESQAVIYRYDEVDAEFMLRCASPKRNLFERIKKNEGLNGRVACECKTIVVHDADQSSPDAIAIKRSDPQMRSFVVTPITLEDRYYGNLGLRHEEVGHFLDTDIQFLEGLAQQLASTIFRLETAQARQDFEQRAKTAEEMSLIGEMAFGLTHRLENDLGLVETYIDDVREELKSHRISNRVITRQLKNIKNGVRKVLDLSEALKDALTGSREAMNEESLAVAPRDLFIQAKLDIAQLLSPDIALEMQIEDDVAEVRVIPRLIVDILHNLIVNAIQAISKPGKITLKARNIGHFVALDVADTGIGVAQENQAKIFSLFYTTKGGFGFGLWNARRNALKSGGDLDLLESQLGKGTVFRLLLPKAE